MDSIFLFAFMAFVFWNIIRGSLKGTARRSRQNRYRQQPQKTHNADEHQSTPPHTPSSPWQDQEEAEVMPAVRHAVMRAQTLRRLRETQHRARHNRQGTSGRQIDKTSDVKDSADKNRTRRADWGEKGDSALFSNRNLLVIAIFVIIVFYVISNLSGQGAL